MNKPRLDSLVRETDKTCTLDLAGEIDLDSAPDFRSALKDVAERGRSHIILNMARVRYVDSSGFAAILGVAKAVRAKDGTVSLVGCNAAVKRIVKLMQLDSILGLFATEDEAHQSVLPKQ